MNTALRPPPKLENPTRETILAQLANREDMKDVTRGIAKRHDYFSEELYQELFLVLCGLPEPKILDLYNAGELDFYIIGVLKRMFNASGHDFNRIIKQPQLNKIDHVDENGEDRLEDYLPDQDNADSTKNQVLDKLDDSISEMTFFDQKILKKYMELKTIKKTAHFFNVNVLYISQSLARSRKNLKNAINKKMNEND